MVTAVVGLIALYRSSIRKSYAAERDFNHLQRNYEALTKNIEFLAKGIDGDIANLAKELDNRCDRLDQNQTEIKALLLSSLGFKKHPGND